ncbi:MAG: DUF551 domain-containing protein [Clostridia bacterium]|nr:DUF551 domain-containing protein [Clostridia bacterium]
MSEKERTAQQAAPLQQGAWISVKDRLPDDDRQVLAVKQLKSGERQICLAYCNLDHMEYDAETGNHYFAPYWVCGGNNNIIFWQDLPDMPEVGS